LDNITESDIPTDSDDDIPQQVVHRQILQSRLSSPSYLEEPDGNQQISHTPSPISGEKRSREEVENDSDIEVDSDVRVVKAQKINNNSGRPKAADYDDASREIILKAASHYRVLISTREAFPDSATEIRMVKEAWMLANKDSDLPPIAISPDISKIVSGTISLCPWVFNNK
jgi:hypothetical protein